MRGGPVRRPVMAALRGALGAALLAALAGCAGGLREDVARQAIELAEARAALAEVQRELRALREDVTRLREGIDAEARQASSRAETEARARERAEQMDARIKGAERRAEEQGEAVAALEASVSSLADQVARLEAAGGGPGTLRPLPDRSRRGTPATSAEELFDRGMESFRAGEVGQAVLDFEDLVERHPGHPLVVGAHFWIGECYFRARDFEHASLAYQKAIDLAPTGERTPDALLRLGLALRSLRREDRAREAWSRLIRDFPESEAAQRARAVMREPGRFGRPGSPAPSVDPR